MVQRDRCLMDPKTRWWRRMNKDSGGVVVPQRLNALIDEENETISKFVFPPWKAADTTACALTAVLYGAVRSIHCVFTGKARRGSRFYCACAHKSAADEEMCSEKVLCPTLYIPRAAQTAQNQKAIYRLGFQWQVESVKRSCTSSKRLPQHEIRSPA